MKVEFKSPRKTSYLLNIIVFNLCRLLPCRNKRLWIFWARKGEKYDENSKYMFEYVQNNHSDTIRAVWLTKDPQVNGYPSFFEVLLSKMNGDPPFFREFFTTS